MNQVQMFPDIQPQIPQVIIRPVDLSVLSYEVFGYWLSGFTDGEGTFLYSNSNESRHAKFKINLRDDDLTILEAIKSYWGMGHIYRQGFRQRGSYLTRPSASYEVFNLDDLPIIIAHFERFPLLSKKSNDFQIWKQIVWLARDKGWHNARIQLDALGEQLKAIRKYPEDDLTCHTQ